MIGGGALRQKGRVAARVGWVGIALFAVATYASWLGAQQADPEFQPFRVLGQQRPITRIPTKSVRQAFRALNPSELVLGVTVGNHSRAYPINMLTGPSREVLNDVLGGQAIAATW